MPLENKNLVINYSSAKYSWIKSGGCIHHLYKIYNKFDLIKLFDEEQVKSKKLLVIGNLSNTLIKDEGFKGIGLKLLGDFASVQLKNDHMLVGAGVLDNYLSKHPNINEIKKFWKDHTAAIKRFHRYPHRNEIMGRKSTPEEIQFLEGPNSSW